MLSLIASRVASSIENARLYRRVDRQNRTLRTLAHLSREFSAILDLDELLTKIASATRALIPYDAFSVFLVDNERSILRNRFSVRYDQRVKIDNIPSGERHYRRGGGIARAGARARYRRRFALYRLAPGHPFGTGGSADRAGPRRGRPGCRKRAHRVLYRGSPAHAFPAGPADREFGGKRPPVRGSRPARAAHGSGSQGGAQAPAHPAAQGGSRDQGFDRRASGPARRARSPATCSASSNRPRTPLSSPSGT